MLRSGICSATRRAHALQLCSILMIVAVSAWQREGCATYHQRRDAVNSKDLVTDANLSTRLSSTASDKLVHDRIPWSCRVFIRDCG